MVVIAAYVVVFLFLSGLLAMVDAAVLSVTHAECEELVMQKARGALWLRRVKQNITQAVVVVVMVTNTINILGPILVGQKAVEVFDSSVIGVITAVLTFGTIIFSEIIPKSLGTHYAPAIARYAAPTIVWLSWGLYPLVILLERIAAFFQRGERHIGTEAQIQSLVTIGLKAGRIEQDEGQMIHQAFRLNDRSAEDIMRPFSEMVTMSDVLTLREAAEIVLQHEFSRYPVLAEASQRVVGMVLGREILGAVVGEQGATLVGDCVHAVPRVPADMRSDMLLVMFRDRQTHLTIVERDGQPIGLVTLEDVLEELVGEIEDEKDEPASHARPVSDEVNGSDS
ncbi:MAG: CNNM domain-containing protein [Planctomycetaceae bacterium]